MVTKRTTRSSGNYHATTVHSGHRDYISLSQREAERARRENFDKGCRWAALALVGLFVFLSMGCVMFGW